MAERVLKALRDNKSEESEPDEQPGPPTLTYRDILGPLEDTIGDFAMLSRLIATRRTNCTFDLSRDRGKQREREERILQGALIGLGFNADEVEPLETFFQEH
ncbi:MAG: hypothetical protein U1E67_04010 [Hyphomicrobiales bacterium]